MLDEVAGQRIDRSERHGATFSGDPEKSRGISG